MMIYPPQGNYGFAPSDVCYYCKVVTLTIDYSLDMPTMCHTISVSMAEPWIE